MPTSRWHEGDLIIDRHKVPLPGDLPDGEYVVSVGFYDPTRRLPVWSGDGTRLPADAAIIGAWDHGG
jgi:hypothetical protein